MDTLKSGVDVEEFKADPNCFIEAAIKDYVARSPINCLTEFDNAPIWGEPVVAFADGDDPVFEQFKQVIGKFHMTPREVLNKHIQAKEWNYAIVDHIENVSVISYVLPIPRETLDVERDFPIGGSRRINHMRWRGETFWRSLEHYICSLLEVMGYHAVAPGRSPFFERHEIFNGPMSMWGARVNWSERHIAYATGLGTFGLHGLLITPKGCAHFVESIVCNVAFRPTGRAYSSHTENCPFFLDGSCKECIARCPSGAISEKGRNILICREYLTYVQRMKLKESGLDKDYTGKAPTCGQCMTNVPCENGIPPSVLRKRSK